MKSINHTDSTAAGSAGSGSAVSEKYQEADTKFLQQQELKILEAFVSICQAHHLTFYLNAGTLLGAVRHKGFIPWDDDIDICMPRSDYERFLQLADQSLPDNLRAVYFRNQTAEEHPQYTCQIVDLNIPLVQMIAETPRKTYAWIDVFPLDGMPSNALMRRIHGCALLIRRALMQVSMLRENVNIHKQRPLHERVIIVFCRKTGFGSRLDTRKQMERLDQSLRKYSDTKAKFWVNFMGAYKLKETFPVSWYGKGKDYDFEEKKLPGPEHAELILQVLYGNWQVPKEPEDREKTHNLYMVAR